MNPYEDGEGSAWVGELGRVGDGHGEVETVEFVHCFGFRGVLVGGRGESDVVAYETEVPCLGGGFVRTCWAEVGGVVDSLRVGEVCEGWEGGGVGPALGDGGVFEVAEFDCVCGRVVCAGESGG